MTFIELLAQCRLEIFIGFVLLLWNLPMIIRAFRKQEEKQ